MKTKEVNASITEMSQLMMPHDANNAGSVHGGVILQFVDKVAAVCAARHSGKICVTASIDRVYFLQPIHTGELVTMKASVNYVGKTSMEIGVRVEAENMQQGKKRHTNSCYVTMVAIDKRGKPIKVPKLKCTTAEQKKRCKKAELRKKENLRMLKQYKKK